MPRKGGVGALLLFFKVQIARGKKKNNNPQNVYIIRIQHRRNSEMWSCISNYKRSSHFKALCLLCEFLQRCFLFSQTHT